jgi:hypothetical protein
VGGGGGGGWLESKLSYQLWLCFSLTLAKPNNNTLGVIFFLIELKFKPTFYFCYKVPSSIFGN